MARPIGNCEGKKVEVIQTEIPINELMEKQIWAAQNSFVISQSGALTDDETKYELDTPDIAFIGGNGYVHDITKFNKVGEGIQISTDRTLKTKLGQQSGLVIGKVHNDLNINVGVASDESGLIIDPLSNLLRVKLPEDNSGLFIDNEGIKIRGIENEYDLTTKYPKFITNLNSILNKAEKEDNADRSYEVNIGSSYINGENKINALLQSYVDIEGNVPKPGSGKVSILSDNVDIKSSQVVNINNDVSEIRFGDKILDNGLGCTGIILDSKKQVIMSGENFLNIRFVSRDYSEGGSQGISVWDFINQIKKLKSSIQTEIKKVNDKIDLIAERINGCELDIQKLVNGPIWGKYPVIEKDILDLQEDMVYLKGTLSGSGILKVNNNHKDKDTTSDTTMSTDEFNSFKSQDLKERIDEIENAPEEIIKDRGYDAGDIW